MEERQYTPTVEKIPYQLAAGDNPRERHGAYFILQPLFQLAMPPTLSAARRVLGGGERCGWTRSCLWSHVLSCLLVTVMHISCIFLLR